MTPDLSVITVCKNAEAGLERTIKNVLGQQGVRLEYIVIDGGSTDETQNVLNRYRNDISFILSEPDDGIYDAMNKGLAHATGELVFFLNVNDFFFNERVAEQVTSAWRVDKPNILFGDVMFSDDGGDVRHSYRDLNLARFFERPLCHQGVFASRQAFEVCGRFNPNYRLAADLDWILRALRRYRLRARYLPFVVSYFDGRGLTSGPHPRMNKLLYTEMNRAMNNYFTPFERLAYKVARRCRLRQDGQAWNLLARIMQWELRT